jgi:hypothetical protein
MFAEAGAWRRCPAEGECDAGQGQQERDNPQLGPGAPAPIEVPGQFPAGRAGVKKSVSSWVTRSAS